MSFPRWRTLTGVTLAVCGVAAASAQAATPVDMVQDLKVTISPKKAGTNAKPKPAGIGVTISSPTPDPATTETVRISFGKGVEFNNRSFPTCSLASIKAARSISRCDPRSIVGRGTARAIGFLGGEKVPETLSVTAINSPGNTLQLFVNGINPLSISQPITGKLVKAGAPYGYRLDVKLPQELREVLDGVYAPLVYFDVDVRATTTVRQGRGRNARNVEVSYVTTTSCPRGGWPFKGDFTFDQAAPFVAGPLTAVSPKAACS